MKRLISRLLSSFAKSPKHGTSLAGKHRVRLQLESLEDRQLLSAPATHWVIEQQPSNIVAGSPITLKVEAETATGSVVPYSGQIILSQASNPAGGILTGALSASETSNGVITLSGMTINQAGSGYSLKVSGGNLTARTTNQFSVLKGSAGTDIWTGDGGTWAWSTPTNWSLDRAPINGDTLVFPSGASHLTNANNMSGLKLNAIDISGSSYNINNYAYSPQPLTVGSIKITGSNDTLALPLNSTLTGNVKDLGANNVLNVSNTKITGTQYIEVSAGNQLVVNPSSGGSDVLFSGGGTLVIDGSGTVLFDSYNNGGPDEAYDTCTTVLLGGTFHIGMGNSPGGGDFWNPSPWGAILLAGGTFGEAGGSSLPSLILYGDVTFDSGINVTGDVVIDGQVDLTLKNAVCDFCTSSGSALDPIDGGHLTLSAAHNSVSGGTGGIVTVPYKQVGLVTAGYDTAVFKNVSNPG
jgi:hypothetical protein